jgi:hypothetical protein
MAVAPAPDTTTTVTIGPVGSAFARADAGVSRAELGEQDVEREHRQHGERDGQQQGREQRDARHKP